MTNIVQKRTLLKTEWQLNQVQSRSRGFLLHCKTKHPCQVQQLELINLHFWGFNLTFKKYEKSHKMLKQRLRYVILWVAFLQALNKISKIRIASAKHRTIGIAVTLVCFSLEITLEAKSFSLPRLRKYCSYCRWKKVLGLLLPCFSSGRERSKKCWFGKNLRTCSSSFKGLTPAPVPQVIRVHHISIFFCI